MRKTDQEVQKLMREHAKHGEVGRAARAAAMDRKTGSKYIRAQKLPSELRGERTWRTRSDPFTSDWPRIRDMLECTPELEAKIVLELLVAEHPDRYQEKHLRTLQRRFKQWRALKGPPRKVFFSQAHVPGEAMQTDFTWGTELEVTIAFEAFAHMICHSVLPYSNWQWVSVCRSESMSSIRRGVQAALFQLGYVPEFHQTDNSTAATHDLRTGKRGFNEEYKNMIEHFGMKPRTIGVGEKEQNGDIEAANGVLKRRIRQMLLLRGTKNFDSVGEYEQWLRGIAATANRGRQMKLKDEIRAMRPLSASRLPEYTEIQYKVSSWSTIKIKSNAYSVPSQLIGEKVRIRVFDTKIDVYLSGILQMTTERLAGKQRHRINYRHIIDSLIRKPGAFQRYRYREDLFPTVTFRQAYDALARVMSPRKADIEYLRCLHLAAKTMECQVEHALSVLMEQGTAPLADKVKAIVAPDKPTIPSVAIPIADLNGYDTLLVECAGVMS
ncbi:MAG: IS21 family transposase [Gemmatimonadales bacterium]